MNWPNRISLMRIGSVPVLTFLLCLKQPQFMWARYVALFLFIIAAISDFVDGHLARKYNLVTNFGKFIDPVADKMLVLSALIMLSWHGLTPAWLVVLVLFRELAVDCLRMVAVEQGKVIAAGKLGKIKTTVQLTMIITHLVFHAHFPLFWILAKWLLIPTQIAMVIMTLWSGIDYFINNKEVLHD